MSDRHFDVFRFLQVLLVLSAGLGRSLLVLGTLVGVYQVHCADVVVINTDKDLGSLISQLLEFILLLHEELLKSVVVRLLLLQLYKYLLLLLGSDFEMCELTL